MARNVIFNPGENNLMIPLFWRDMKQLGEMENALHLLKEKDRGRTRNLADYVAPGTTTGSLENPEIYLAGSVVNNMFRPNPDTDELCRNYDDIDLLVAVDEPASKTVLMRRIANNIGSRVMIGDFGYTITKGPEGKYLNLASHSIRVGLDPIRTLEEVDSRIIPSKYEIVFSSRGIIQASAEN